MKKYNFIYFVLVSVFLTSCSSINRIVGEDDAGDTFNSSTQGEIGNITEGNVLSIREVKLSGSKAIGVAGGAIIGATAGSSINKAKNDKLVAGTLGALAGSLVGGLLEKNITEKTAFEFIVKLDSG